jgi:hypothetical protein
MEPRLGQIAGGVHINFTAADLDKCIPYQVSIGIIVYNAR